MTNLKNIGTLIQKFVKISKIKYIHKLRNGYLQKLYGNVQSPKIS